MLKKNQMEHVVPGRRNFFVYDMIFEYLNLSMWGRKLIIISITWSLKLMNHDISDLG